MLNFPPQLIGAGAAALEYLLDIQAARFAYSLRLVSSTYSGSCIRVVESGGSTEADIGFADGWLDETALLAHCGANDGYVSKWYDQSGNGDDVGTSVGAQQPRIVSGGVVDKLNGKPALWGRGGKTTELKTAASYTIDDMRAPTTYAVAVSVVMYQIGATADNRVFDMRVDQDNSLGVWATFNDLIYWDAGRDAAGNRSIETQPAGWDDAQHHVFCGAYGSYQGTRVDATTLGSITFSPVPAVTGATTIKVIPGNDALDGYIQELVCYAADISTVESEIETDVNSAFSIY